MLFVWKPGKPLRGWKPQNQNECGRGCGLRGLRKGEGMKKKSVVESGLGVERDGIRQCPALISLQAARRSPGVWHQEDLAVN